MAFSWIWASAGFGLSQIRALVGFGFSQIGALVGFGLWLDMNYGWTWTLVEFLLAPMSNFSALVRISRIFYGLVSMIGNIISAISHYGK